MVRLRSFVTFPLVVAAVAAGLFAALPAASQADKDKALIARGDYLATMFGCKDCHTPGFFYGAPDHRRELSGSEVGWHGPWGVTYPPNLTPDPETGLGKWTDDQILRALRTGVRPDNTVLRPPMPWQNYSRMNDEDARALIAYLRSLPAIKHQEPAALPPGQQPTGAVFDVPSPPAWDAPRK
jgi:mono/diheme cytochrome c family protein